MKQERTARTLLIDEAAIEKLNILKSKFRVEGFRGVSLGMMLEVLALSDDAERIIKTYLKKHGKKHNKAITPLRRAFAAKQADSATVNTE